MSRIVQQGLETYAKRSWRTLAMQRRLASKVWVEVNPANNALFSPSQSVMFTHVTVAGLQQPTKLWLTRDQIQLTSPQAVAKGTVLARS
jgi:hypothetical protein